MSKACISRNIDRLTIINSSTATAPSLQVRDQNFPTGDVAVEALHFRYDATVSNIGTTPTKKVNGNRIWLNAITVQTDKHLKIVDSVDGVLLWARNLYDFGTTPNETQLAATPTTADLPSCSWIIPFALFHGIRPYDTHMDMMVSRMKVLTQFGAPCNGTGTAVNADLFNSASGSPTVNNLIQSIESKILPGPLQTVNDPANGLASELPVYMSTFEQMQVPVNQTTNRYQIALPFGDRIYRRIFITQRNTSDRTEMSNVLAGTAFISLYINNIPIVDQRVFQDIVSANKLEYGIETANLPTGVCVLDFDSVFEERFNDMLFALTLNSGNMYLYVDVTSQTNGSLLIGLDCLKPVPPAALRAA